MTAVVRPARPEDAETLASLGRATFVETFVEDFAIPYPAADLEAYLGKAFAIATIRDRLRDPTQAWWIAERAGDAIGFANAGPNTLPHPEARPSHAELRRLYVTKPEQGAGLGTRLLDTALSWMRGHTEGPLWIGVWSGNLKAQKLYAAYGFEHVGDYKYPVGAWFDDEFILRKR